MSAHFIRSKKIYLSLIDAKRHFIQGGNYSCKEAISDEYDNLNGDISNRLDAMFIVMNKPAREWSILFN